MSEVKLRTTKDSKSELKETCSACHKKVTTRGIASLTGWIFKENRCTCKNEIEPKSSDAAPDLSETETVDEQIEAIDLGDRYELLGRIGQGGMGSVFKVRDKSIDKILAVKVLRPELATHKSSLRRFEQEAEAAKDLTHPNLVAVYGHMLANGSPCIIMECLEGESLADVLKKEHHLDVSRALDIFIQVSDAVAHAHMKSVIHRDLKPGNIILTKTDSGSDFVKIVDFGIAKILSGPNRETLEMTQTGELFGSPSYMSPEQCLGIKLDARSDIYSLGCVMYEALTGKPPFGGNNPVQTIVKHLNEIPRSFSKDFKGLEIPLGLEAIVMRCLEKDAALRYQTMDALMIDIESVREGRKLAKYPKSTPKFNLAISRRQVIIFLVAAPLTVIAALTNGPWKEISVILCALALGLFGCSFLIRSNGLYKAISKSHDQAWPTAFYCMLGLTVICVALLVCGLTASSMHIPIPHGYDMLWAVIGLASGMGLLFVILAISFGFGWLVIRFAPNSSRRLPAAIASAVTTGAVAAFFSTALLANILAQEASTILSLSDRGDPPPVGKLLLNTAISLNPSVLRAHITREMYDSPTDQVADIEDLTNIIRLLPLDSGYQPYPVTHYIASRARAYEQMKEFGRAKADRELAIIEYGKEIAKDPDNCWAYAGRADCYENLGEFDKAFVDYAAAERVNKAAAADWVLEAHGHALFLNKQYSDAVAMLSKSIELNPTYLAYLWRGKAYTMLGQEYNALRDYQKAEEMLGAKIGYKADGPYAERLYYFYRGVARNKLGALNGAKEDLDKAKELGYKPSDDEKLLTE